MMKSFYPPKTHLGTIVVADRCVVDQMEKIVSFLPLERPLPGPENEARTYVWQTLASAPPP